MNKSIIVMLAVMAMGCSAFAESNWDVSPEIGVTFGDRVGYAVGGTVGYNLSPNWAVEVEVLYMDAQTDLDENIDNADVYLTPKGLLTGGVRYNIPMPEGYQEIRPFVSAKVGVQPVDQHKAGWQYYTIDDPKKPNERTTHNVDSVDDSDVLGVITGTIGVNIDCSDITEGANVAVGFTVMQTTPVDFVDDTEVQGQWGDLVNAPVVGSQSYDATTAMLWIGFTKTF